MCGVSRVHRTSGVTEGSKVYKVSRASGVHRES